MFVYISSMKGGRNLNNWELRRQRIQGDRLHQLFFLCPLPWQTGQPHQLVLIAKTPGVGMIPVSTVVLQTLFILFLEITPPSISPAFPPFRLFHNLYLFQPSPNSTYKTWAVFNFESPGLNPLNIDPPAFIQSPTHQSNKMHLSPFIISMDETATPTFGPLAPTATVTVTLHTTDVTSTVPGVLMSTAPIPSTAPTTSTTLITFTVRATSTVRTKPTPTVTPNPTHTPIESTVTLGEEPVSSATDMPFHHDMREAGMHIH